MINLLNRIIKECESRDIKTSYDEDTGRYAIKGLAEGEPTELFIENDNAIVFENNYNDQEHVLSIRDLIEIANYWKLKYKDYEAWKSESPGWTLAFKEFIGGVNYHGALEEEDLPF